MNDSKRRSWKLVAWHLDAICGRQIPVFDPPLEITGFKRTLIELQPHERIFTRDEIESAFAKALGVECAKGWSTGILILNELFAGGDDE